MGTRKIQKAITSFIMSIRPSFRPPVFMKQLVYHFNDFHEI
jgi:hypothetical protein